MVNILIYVAELLMAKKKRSRKKDYFETISAIICLKLYYYNVSFFDQICMNRLQSCLTSCCDLIVTVELVTNNVSAYT